VIFVRETVTERDVVNFLDSLNMPHSNLGFLYLVKLIHAACRDQEMNLHRRVMALYDEVSPACNSTPARVERAIRTLLKRENYNMTNGQFIYWAVDKLVYGDPSEIES